MTNDYLALNAIKMPLPNHLENRFHKLKLNQSIFSLLADAKL